MRSPVTYFGGKILVGPAIAAADPVRIELPGEDDRSQLDLFSEAVA